MSNRLKPCDRDQQFLLPPSLQDWLPPGDLAYFIIDVADHLDLTSIHNHCRYYRDQTTGELRAEAASGQSPYESKKMMVALVLDAYCVGTPSSRKIAALCERDAGYRVVAAVVHGHILLKIRAPVNA